MYKCPKQSTCTFIIIYLILLRTLKLTSGQLGSVTSIGFPESHPSLMCLFKGMSPVMKKKEMDHLN